jgi:hypothetical protein
VALNCHHLVTLRAYTFDSVELVFFRETRELYRKLCAKIRG